MRSPFPGSLARDQLGWIDLQSGIRTNDAAEHANRQIRTARALLQRLFGVASVPGVILGDEVGMGKTYEALAVIAALFVHVPTARVLVLTHSHAMAKIWAQRWDGFREHAVGRTRRALLAPSEILYDVADFGAGQIGFASYDRLKRMPSHELCSALVRCFKGRYLRAKTRRTLLRDLDVHLEHYASELAERIPQRAIDGFWRTHFDASERCWQHPWAARAELRRLVYRASRTKRRVDLLVVDEAHKVASRQRSMFFEEVLGSRARRALYVTATPFSLSVDQLHERIEDMYVVTGAPLSALAQLWKDLERFRDIVVSRGELPQTLKAALEQRLGRHLVRSLWRAEIANGVPRRNAVRAPVGVLEHDEERAQAMLALETAFVHLEGAGGRTHATAHRETLCSSYAAIRGAAEQSRRRRVAFAPHLVSLARFLPARGELPKFQGVLDYLVDVARRREKAVVFCARIATVTALRNALHERLRNEMEAERKRWDRVRNRLRVAERKGLPRLKGKDGPKLRLAVHRFGEVTPGKETAVLKRVRRLLRKSGEPGEEDSRIELWDQSWGPRRRVDWVGVLAGQHGDDEGRRSPEAVQFAFNLPGPPYVLLCTEIAREGIDLHLWCRRVVQYDLDWNPALMEQQIGRVDRIGSLSRRAVKPLDVVWAWVPHSYEDYMARKVRERMEMMKVLLGAGEWLADSPEEQASVSDLEKYELNFAP